MQRNTPDYSELKDKWDKKGDKTLKLRIPKAIDFILDLLISDFDYHHRGQSTLDGRTNFLICAALQKYIEDVGLEELEAIGMKVKDFGMEIKNGKVVVREELEPNSSELDNKEAPAPG